MRRKTINSVLKYLYTLCCWIILVIICGCFHSPVEDVYYYNAKPDDEISKSIKKSLGKKLYYNEKDVDEQSRWCRYYYLIKDYDDEKMIQEIIDAVEGSVDDDNYSNRYISITLTEAFPGATEPVVCICNYYNTVDGSVLCDGFKCLEIYGTTHSDHNKDSRYNDAKTYIGLKNIKSVEYTSKIQKSAEKEGIVWADIWPDLENCELIESDN